MALSDTLCPSGARHSYLRFRLPPILLKRKCSILRLTKGNKGHDDQVTENTKNSRVYVDPRVNMLGERVERVWEEPLLHPRQVYR